MSLSDSNLSEANIAVNSEQIVELFDALFKETYATVLLGGADEPLYEVLADRTARIVFREDFVASALHEVAHWCLAGKRRRQQNDYGYWYVAERDGLAQATFEQVETRPQALEWIFSSALGIRFRVSADNLDLEGHDQTPFRTEVRAEVWRMLTKGLGVRAKLFAFGLSEIAEKNVDAFSAEQYRELPN